MVGDNLLKGLAATDRLHGNHGLDLLHVSLSIDQLLKGRFRLHWDAHARADPSNQFTDGPRPENAFHFLLD